MTTSSTAPYVETPTIENLDNQNIVQQDLSDFQLPETAPTLTNKFFITKVEKFTRGVNLAYDILADFHGNLWIGNYGQNELLKLDFGTNKLSVYKYNGGLSGILGMAFNPRDPNWIYVSCQNNHTLSRLNVVTNTWQTLATGLQSPRGLAFTSNGDLYLTRLHEKEQLCYYPHGSDFKAPAWTKGYSPENHGVWTTKVDPKNDEVYISYYSSSSLIKTVAGTKQQRWAESFGNLNGMCFYENHLFVTDRSSKCVRVLDVSTGTMETLNFKLDEIYCITVDPARKLFYVSSDKGFYRLSFVDTVSRPLFKKYPPKFNGDIHIVTTTL